MSQYVYVLRKAPTRSITCSVLYCACSELFPTLIRSAVLGYQNQAARVGGIIAPFVVMASASSASGGNQVPFLTFGAAAVLAGLLIFTLPETLGVPLPDTLQVGTAPKNMTACRLMHEQHQAFPGDPCHHSKCTHLADCVARGVWGVG